MKNLYSSLLSPAGQILQEPKALFQCFNERHLQAIWLEQKYFKILKTSSGEQIKVVSPGIWNHNSGPDFLKAHFTIGEVEIYGDVEIHLSAGDWYHHGHHRDVRYNNVVLHVVLWNPKIAKPIITEDAKNIPQAFLENHLTYPLAKLVHLIDLDLYPYKKFLGSGKCSQLLFKELPDQSIFEFFQSAAAWRLLQKGNNLQYRVENPSCHLSAGMAMALGYKNNSEIFLQLFLLLYPLRHLGEEALYALALGSCGIFNKNFYDKWGGSDYYQHYHALYLMLALTYQVNFKFPLVYHQIRPFNHPVRRLACLVKLLIDESLSSLYPKMAHLWSQEWQKHHNWPRLRKELIDSLPSYKDSYWSYHYVFEKDPQADALPMMGKPLKQEILVNVFLPLLYCEISDRCHQEEMERFKDFYNTFSASFSGKSKYLAHRFFGDSSRKELLHQADVEQGAFQLHRDFCLHYEASCEGCPFIDNYKNFKNSR